MRLNTDVSRRISMLRPLLIIGVVYVHVAGVSDLPSELAPGIFNWFAAFFKNGVFRGTVPTMSLIAGFLLFSSGLDRQPGKLFKKKFVTLLVPFIIFNLYCFGFMELVNLMFGQVFPTLATWHETAGRTAEFIFGVTTYPINGPLHFVRDMMVAIAMVPLLSFMLRTLPWIGFIASAIFFGMDYDGLLIFRASSLLLFYVGGAAAIYKWNLLALDQFAKECLGIFVVVCLIIIGFKIDDNTVLVTVAPFLIWPAASLLKGSRLEKWAIGFCKYSFFIFVAHMPIIGTMWWYMMHHARWIPYPVFWFAAPALTVLILKMTYDFAISVAPTAFNFAIGSRANKPAFADRRLQPRASNAPVYSDEARLGLAARS